MRFETTPVPHIYIDELISPDDYAQLEFPILTKHGQGRTGRDIYQGDPTHAEIVSRPGWKQLYQRFTSEDFLRQILEAFAPHMRRLGCAVDPDNWYLDPYHETLKETQTQFLDTAHPTNALFTRFDLQEGDSTYVKPPHVDHPRRIVGGVLYLCDANEEGMTGGNFALYLDDDFRNDRRCRVPIKVREYPIHHNTGILFLNCNTAFHGATPITEIQGTRRWIYFSLSSRQPVWFPGKQPLASKIMRKARKLASVFR